MNKNNFDVDGEIRFISMPVTPNPAKNFTYRFIILELITDRFVTEGKFMFINKNIDLLNKGFSVGDRVSINFQITGRSFIRKDGTKDWAVTLRAQNISKL